MSSSAAELAREDIAAVRRKVDGIRRPWPEWGGGWPGQIEAALIDAVLSIQAKVATQTNVNATALDHAVWQYARKTGRRKLGCS